MTKTKQVPVEFLKGITWNWYTYEQLRTKAEEYLAAPATEPSGVERLAMEIADKYAKLVVDECGEWDKYVDGECWTLSGDCEDQSRYLDLRGLLEHHPDHPEWVRIKEQKS